MDCLCLDVGTDFAFFGDFSVGLGGLGTSSSFFASWDEVNHGWIYPRARALQNLTTKDVSLEENRKFKILALIFKSSSQCFSQKLSYQSFLKATVPPILSVFNSSIHHPTITHSKGKTLIQNGAPLYKLPKNWQLRTCFFPTRQKQ